MTCLYIALGALALYGAFWCGRWREMDAQTSARQMKRANGRAAALSELQGQNS